MDKNPKIIVISNQKGGIGKTFTAGALAFLLSTDSHEKIRIYKHQRKAERVLVVDTDFQGDATSLVTRHPQSDFNGQGLMAALDKEDATDFIYKVNENLSILPATPSVAEFDTLITLNESNIEDPQYLLSRTLEKVKDQFDWIIIDTAPSLSKMKLQALNVNFGDETHVLIPMQTEDFGFQSVLKFADTLSAIQNTTNPSLNILGVLPILTDPNMAVDQDIIKEAKEAFEDLVFNTVIKRKAELKKMVRSGFTEHFAEQRKSLADYYDLLVEVKERV